MEFYKQILNSHESVPLCGSLSKSNWRVCQLRDRGILWCGNGKNMEFCRDNFVANLSRLREIRRSRQTCRTNFENVWRGAPVSSDKMSSKVSYLPAIYIVKWLTKTQNVWWRTPASSDKMTNEGQKVFANPAWGSLNMHDIRIVTLSIHSGAWLNLHPGKC